jgi:hypothetical protein
MWVGLRAAEFLEILAGSFFGARNIVGQSTFGRVFVFLGNAECC